MSSTDLSPSSWTLDFVDFPLGDRPARFLSVGLCGSLTTVFVMALLGFVTPAGFHLLSGGQLLMWFPGRSPGGAPAWRDMERSWACQIEKLKLQTNVYNLFCPVISSQ